VYGEVTVIGKQGYKKVEIIEPLHRGYVDWLVKDVIPTLTAVAGKLEKEQSCRLALYSEMGRTASCVGWRRVEQTAAKYLRRRPYQRLVGWLHFV